MTEHEKDLERIKNFSLMDDDFMTACFSGNTECAELVLRLVLGRNDLKVIEAHTQYSIKNLTHRSVRLDVLAVDETGARHNIEIQRSDKGASPKRARYNGSLIDADISEPGEEYDNLPDVYVVFITENDLFKKNCPIYHFEHFCTANGISLGDGSHIIYVNGSYRDDSPIGKLIADFHCKEPQKMYYSALKERASYFKENPEGVGSMCRAIEEMRMEAAKTKGILTAKNLLLLGKLTIEEIALACGLTVAEVAALAMSDSSTSIS